MKDFWNGLTPRTRQVVFAVVGIVLIAAMITGNFDAIIGLFK